MINLIMISISLMDKWKYSNMIRLERKGIRIKCNDTIYKTNDVTFNF